MTSNNGNKDQIYKSRYRALLSSHSDLVFRYGPDFKITFVSSSICRFFDLSEDELLAKPVENLVPAQDGQPPTQERHEFITPADPVLSLSGYMRRAQGMMSSVEWIVQGLFDDEGGLLEYQAVGRDMSELFKAQEELIQKRLHYVQAAQIASLGYWVWDEIEDRLIFCSDEAAELFGVTVDAALERSDTLEGNLSSTHPDDLEYYENTVMEAFENKTGYDITVRTYLPSGELRYIRQLAEPVLDKKGNLIQSVGTVQDVTDQKRSEEQVAYMAHHDTLTDLPNRALFMERLETGLKMAARESRQLAVLFVDLDGFKKVNDVDGHSAGDQLLVEVSSRLSKCIRETDTIARIGGDEFAAILSGDANRKHVEIVAGKIIETVSAPYEIKGNVHRIGASIGISLYPDTGTTADALLAAADSAMYEVKRSGKNNFLFA